MIAAFFLASALTLAGVPQKPVTVSPGQAADQARLKQCVAMIDDDPENAYEQAKAWAHETRAPEADRCAALAMIARGEPETGAKQLEQLAGAKNALDGPARADMMVEAGNAWLLAEKPAEAIADLNAALKLAPKSPDALIDRARAYELGSLWRNAEEDLSAALDLRPNDSYALALRAKARVEQGAVDLALKDVNEALALEPKNEIALLVRGQALQAKAKAGK